MKMQKQSAWFYRYIIIWQYFSHQEMFNQEKEMLLNWQAVAHISSYMI